MNRFHTRGSERQGPAWGWGDLWRADGMSGGDPAMMLKGGGFRRGVVIVGDDAGVDVKFQRGTEGAGGGDQVGGEAAGEEVAGSASGQKKSKEEKRE